MSEYTCVICEKEVSQERALFLIDSGVDIRCLEHANPNVKKGIFVDDGLVLCRRVYNDSVKSMLSDSEEPEATE